MIHRAVLVYGGGIGGIAAALEVAGSGFPVYLVERGHYIGGGAARVDRWFPHDGCQMCQLLPVFSADACSSTCLRHGLAHPGIEVITGARIETVTGDAGNFEVGLRTMSTWIDAARCTACGRCVTECPVEAPDDDNTGMRRKAVFGRPLATPPAYAIDRDTCNRCGKCVTVCPTGAIDLSLPDVSRKLAVGAMIISSGSEAFNPARMGQYGYGRYPNVVTSVELERMLDRGGAGGGKVVRPSDGRPPRSVAFLQCVGSRDRERDYCSTVCCMAAIKEAVLVKEQCPAARVEVFHMDMRDYGRGYHRYYRRALEHGIGFTMCRVPAVRHLSRTKNLSLPVQAEDGTLLSREFDLVVLSVGQCASPDMAELSRALGIGVNRWGFIESAGPWTVRTARQGIYACGSAIAPADISGTVSQASAAACEASALLSEVRNRATQKTGTPASASPRIAVFVCRCGDEISAALDIEDTVAFARGLPGVAIVRDMPHPCLPPALDEIRQTLTESGVNRVVLAACAPYRSRLERAVREAGVDPSMCQVVNLREEIVRVHLGNRALATDKAHRMLSVSVERLKGQEPAPASSSEVNHRGLVIGGGVSGMVAALSLAGQWLEVSLVERSARLGGYTANICDGDPQSFVRDLCARVESDPRICVYLNSDVVATSGYAGDFHTRVSTPAGPVTIDHGAAIIATGAADYTPTEYLYGQDERIVTGHELRARFADGTLGKPRTVVMVQCVGSRDGGQPYCSRTCCTDAIASSVRIKQDCPQTQVFVLYRDIMTCGFDEERYTQAREAGVLFIRYTPDRKPEVSLLNGEVIVRVDDAVLRETLEIRADLLALSTGVVPADNRELAENFGVELDEDGFFKEVSPFRPVDTARDGVFVCGMAASPVPLEEAVVQAQAAAHRAASILARERLVPAGAVSAVNERRCRGCALCVAACAYGAREIDEDRKVAVVREALCRGCGACAAVCPSGAAEVRNLREKQVFSMIETALEPRRTSDERV